MTQEDPPSRVNVQQLLSDLLGGRRSREEAATWASRHMNAVEFNDQRLQEAMVFLADVDRPGRDRLYQYGPDDFRDRLDDFLDEDLQEDDHD